MSLSLTYHWKTHLTSNAFRLEARMFTFKCSRKPPTYRIHFPHFNWLWSWWYGTAMSHHSSPATRSLHESKLSMSWLSKRRKWREKFQELKFKGSKSDLLGQLTDNSFFRREIGLSALCRHRTNQKHWKKHYACQRFRFLSTLRTLNVMLRRNYVCKSSHYQHLAVISETINANDASLRMTVSLSLSWDLEVKTVFLCSAFL